MPDRLKTGLSVSVAGLGHLCYILRDFYGRGDRFRSQRQNRRACFTHEPGLNIGRVDVSEPASISSGIALRYATAVFDLAQEENALPALEGDLDALEAAMADSADLRDLLNSPIYSRAEMQAGISAVAGAMGLGPILGNTLKLMAAKRRLFVVPALTAKLRDLIAEHKGEVVADVTSAKALTKTQSDKLAKSLAGAIGKQVKLNATVDADIIGGLVVKVGSKMIDTSIRSKLNSLQNTMKEVG